MKKIILLYSLALLISCNSNTETVKGDLYFKLVNLTPPTGMSEQEIAQLEKTLTDFQTDTNEHSKERELLSHFKKLEEQELLGLPYIMIKEVNGAIKQIYVSKNEYEKIKPFTLEYLQTNHKKITLELKLKAKDGILYSDKIIKIDELNGETFSSK